MWNDEFTLPWNKQKRKEKIFKNNYRHSPKIFENAEEPQLKIIKEIKKSQPLSQFLQLLRFSTNNQLSTHKQSINSLACL